jgi:hypothetical protein
MFWPDLRQSGPDFSTESRMRRIALAALLMTTACAPALAPQVLAPVAAPAPSTYPLA